MIKFYTNLGSIPMRLSVKKTATSPLAGVYALFGQDETPASFRTISVAAISNTPPASPNWLQTASRISGKIEHRPS
jgi:hypothetical protein